MRLNRAGYKPLKWSVVSVALIGGLLLAGCDSSKQSQPHPTVPEVATVTVQLQEVVLTTELPGRTSAFRVAEIRPQVSGLILKRLFTEGSDVKAGQVLYRIDPAEFQAALDNAKASLVKAEANLPAIQLRTERYRELLADKAVSRQDYDDADAALKQAGAEIEYWKVQVKMVRINLEYTKITAPISGRIGRSSVTEGAIVTAYQPVALATIQRLRLRRRLEEGQLKQNKKNQSKVKLLMEDGMLYTLEGTLQFRDVSVDPTTGSVILRIVFPNPEGVLLPGMFVRAVMTEGVNKQAILVPQQAVSRNPKGEPLALIVDDEG